MTDRRQGTDDRQIKKMSGLVIEEGEADKILAVVIGQVTGSRGSKASLLDRLAAAKQKTAAAAAAALEASFLRPEGTRPESRQGSVDGDPERRHCRQRGSHSSDPDPDPAGGPHVRVGKPVDAGQLKRQGIIQQQQANAAAAQAAARGGSGKGPGRSRTSRQGSRGTRQEGAGGPPDSTACPPVHRARTDGYGAAADSRCGGSRRRGASHPPPD